ncbi:hypothetical protein LOC68_25105 [Blastopirellula sp. JC732]|uniref:Leucine Rich repeats (2 copies) n=1 Tax=Blastopirellula sediminis TaxID=2894196 RepID=A0A9X1MQV4_9BACT|nr:hypothetical protein [Blastopirellula sediminis]MCC9605012.1 hypothetical protein [Blastopirellula sediminis]MCC9631688.1 hypothetical protein [Blastopirellula sediminis]
MVSHRYCIATFLLPLVIISVATAQPAPIPGSIVPQVATDESLDTEAVVAELEKAGCTFGYADSLRNDLFRWHEYACVRVEGDKLKPEQWKLLLQLPDVKLLSLHKTEFRDEVGSVLSQLHQLTELQLHESFDDKGIRAVTTLSPLKALLIAKTKASPDSFFGLEELRKLEQVEFTDLVINQTVIGGLRGLPRLNQFNIRNSELALPWGLDPSSFPQLKTLSIDGGKASEELIREVCEVPTLEQLQLSCPSGQFTTDDFRRLTGLPNLVDLSIAKSSLPDASCPLAQPQQKIQKLNVGGTGVGDQFLSTISDFANLRELDLTGTKVTDGGLAYLSELSHLESLTLSDTDITTAGAKHFAQLQSLRELHLHGAKLDGEAFIDIAKLKNLEWIDLSQSNVRGEHLLELRKLPKLRGIVLMNTPIGTADLPYLKQLYHIEEIYVEETKLTNEEQIKLHEALAKARNYRPSA